MPSKKPNPYLVVLDVGHGNAAVLHDAGGTVVFDTGKGAHVGRHLRQVGVRRVQAMLLSHADEDHIGGAVSLLLDTYFKIEEVLLNADASKNSDVFKQLRYALAEANVRNRTRIDRRLATSTNIQRKGLRIEVLHPPDSLALSGAGSAPKTGKKHTSNSLSAAIRILGSSKCSILLGGDIEYDCLDGWKARQVQPKASVLIFPHHGGLPGTTDKSEIELFAFELAKMVSPEFVVFSNHRTKHGNPRDEVLSAILKAAPAIRFACTQLPERFLKQVSTNTTWSLHKSSGGKVTAEGTICFEFKRAGLRFSFGELP
jgi:beta-lactamase superfamily II metal-dependent hydrolase